MQIHLGSGLKKSMDNYLILKLVHILSAVVVTGTGAGIAFFMLMAYRSDNVQAIYVTAELVILGDWIFTTPAIVTLFTSGIMLMNVLSYSFESVWFRWVTACLYLLAPAGFQFFTFNTDLGTYRKLHWVMRVFHPSLRN